MTKNVTFKRVSFLSAAVFLGLTSHSVQAGFGNVGSTFGLSPVDIATAQSLSLFNSQPSAAYYNPSALSTSPEGETLMGLMSATPDIESKITAPGLADETKIYEEATQPVILGMKANLSDMFDLPIPVHAAIISGIENFGSEMMAFSSHTSKDGQVTNYGEKPLFAVASGSIELYPGFSLGAGAQISLHAKADMNLESELDGSAAGNESVFVAAEPVLTPVAGITLNFGRMLCGYDIDCDGDGITLAAAYRGESYGQAVIGAKATIPDVVVELPINLTTYDAYQPDILSAGIQIKKSFFTFAISAEQQKWSALNELMLNDTVKDQAELGFEDTVVPRIGFSIDLSDSLTFMAGASVEESPLDPEKATLNVNYLSADTTTFGGGLTYRHAGDGDIDFPWRIDLAYQIQMLDETDNVLSHEDSAVSRDAKVSGNVSTFAVSFSSKF